MKQNRKAFIFDMDGTMFDNMQFHLQAWEKMVGELGSPLRGPELFKHLYGKNVEVLDRVFGEDRFSQEQKENVSRRKDEYFREFYAPHIRLIKGLNNFLIKSYQQNILLGIGTGGLLANIDFALDNVKIRQLFSAIVCDMDVEKSKPDPGTFLKVAEKLGVTPDQAIVFEDVPKGVEAAAKAGMKAVVILTSHTPADFDRFNNVIKCVHDYSELALESLFVKDDSSLRSSLRT